MVHDQSSTGSTLFIEPLSVVNLNNELKTLLIEEQEEIEAILAELSNQTAEHVITLESDYRVLVELDFIFAKAELAKDYNGVAPLFNTEGRINIRRGRHPLLDQKKVVPIDIRLGEDFAKGLQSAARIICLPAANKFHTCRLRSIFCQVHAPAKNGLHLICRLRAANSARLS